MLKITSIGDELSYSIKTYDIDHRKKATPVALLRMMHETAMQNVIRLKISVWDLEPQQLAWVLTNFYVDFHRLPMMGERIHIRTQPAGFERVFTYRDYEAVDDKGEVLFSASSAWLLMNTVSRRMSRIPDFIRHFESSVPSPEDCFPRARLKIPAVEEAEKQKSFQVAWHDLDFNGHANNVSYVRWMLEPLAEILMQKELKRLEIQFKSECQWQEKLISEATQGKQDTFLHQLCKKGEDKTVAVARTYWRAS